MLFVFSYQALSDLFGNFIGLGKKKAPMVEHLDANEVYASTDTNSFNINMKIIHYV